MRKRQTAGIALLAPNNLAIVMLIFSILMTLFQPEFYQQLIAEPDAMFINWKMYLYMVAMVGFFMLGGYIFNRFSRVEKYSSNDSIDSTFNLLFMSSLFVLLFAGLNISVLLSVIQVIGFTEFVHTTLHPSNDARIMLSQVKAGNGLSWLSAASNGLLSYIIWLVIGRLSNKSQPTLRQIYGWSLLIIFFALNLISALSTQARGPVLSLILQATFGVIAAYVYHRKLNIRRLLSSALILFTISVVFFGIVQKSRFTAGGSQIPFSLAISKAFVGYFPASYNRLAFIIDHKLTLPGAGSGYLALQGIYTFPGISNLFKIDDIGRSLGLPVPQDEFTAWLDSFSSIRYSGLNQSFIWPTVWGGALLDFGLLSPIWWFIYGLLGSWSFREFKKFSFYGLLIYPWFAVTVLEWYGDAVIGNRTLAILFIMSFLMSCLMYLIRRAPQRKTVRRIILNDD